MSKMGNHIVGMQETADYQFGWESAERGEPYPEWPDPAPSLRSQELQKMGWNDFHNNERIVL